MTQLGEAGVDTKYLKSRSFVTSDAGDAIVAPTTRFVFPDGLVEAEDISICGGTAFPMLEIPYN